VSVYARVAKGFRGPTIQGRSAVFNATSPPPIRKRSCRGKPASRAPAGQPPAPERHGLHLHGHDIQLNGNDSNGNGVLFNADKAKAYGLEADAECARSRT
jgi:iron complex outermembrane receptor protein